MKKNILGIYFGIDSVFMTMYRNGTCVLIPNREHSNITPAVVSFAKDGEVLIGEKAKKQQIMNAGRTASCLRLLAGTNYSKEINGIVYSIERILGIFFKRLKEDAENYIKESISAALVIVPYEYKVDDNITNSLEQGAYVAGFEECFFESNEFILAGHYLYSSRKSIGRQVLWNYRHHVVGKQEEHVLLCFPEGMDVKLLAVNFFIKSNQLSVKVMDRVSHTTSAECWDTVYRFVDSLEIEPYQKQERKWLCRIFHTITGLYTIEIAQELGISNALTVQRIYNAVEDIQKTLLNHPQEKSACHLYVPYVGANADGPIHIDRYVSEHSFEKCSKPFVELLEKCREEFFNSPNISRDEIFTSVEYGGIVQDLSSQIVSRTYADSFPLYIKGKPCSSVDSCKALAIGITKTSIRKKYQKLKKSPVTIGFVTDSVAGREGVPIFKVFPIIKQEEELPLKHQFSLSILNQLTKYELPIAIDGDTKILGKLELTGITPVKNPAVRSGKEWQNIYVTLDMNEFGELQAVAYSSSGAKAEAEFGI